MKLLQTIWRDLTTPEDFRGAVIATVKVSDRISAQGPLVWRRDDCVAVDVGGGRIVEASIIEPRRPDDG